MSKSLADKPAYRQVETAFNWNMALDSLGWSGQATVDLADTIVDRHVRSGKADSTAIVWVGTDGTERRITFGELASESARFANLLLRVGVAKGDRVAIILPRIPEVIPGDRRRVPRRGDHCPDFYRIWPRRGGLPAKS